MISPLHNEGPIGKPATSIIIKEEKPNAFPLRSGTAHRCPLLPPCFNIQLEVLARAIRREKDVKDISEGKKQNYLYLQMTRSCMWETPKTRQRKTIRTNKQIP